MLTLISTLSLAVVAILVFCFVIPLVKYNHAQELLELGKYDLAYSAFSELGDYSDAQEKLTETRYLQAVDYRRNGDFDVANKIFESLGDYKDSKALIHIHDYAVSDSVAATCTSKGSETTVCSGCGNSKVRIIEATAHNYVLSQQKKPTCTASGEDTFACSDCGNSYKKVVEMVSHNYVLAKQTNASCVSAGEKRYSCSMCGDSYTEKIEQTAHNWKNATCSAPKTCTTCGKTEGSALGHSNNVICTRCGTNLFKTQEYSGYGVSSITGINLPKGKYNFIFTHSGSSNFIVKGSGGIWVNQIGKTSYVDQIDCSYDGMKNGYINITHAGGYWTIKIEAIGN